MSSSSKAIVIGLDGGSWNTLDKLMDEGILPTIEGLVESGIRADLRSTIPPVTPSAWTSFATGCNPGKHGIFGFMTPVPGSRYGYRTVNRSDVRMPSLWRMLSGMGKRSVVINVPVTFPPEKIEGYLISGFMAPGLDSEFTYPGELKNKLGEWGLKYRLNNKDFPALRDVDLRRDKSAYEKEALLLIDDLFDLTETRWNTCKQLSQTNWDLLLCVFYGADRLQHYFWDHMPGNEADGDVISKRIREFFALFDERLGDFLDRWDGANVLVASDHGFEKFHGDLLVNSWLQEIGLLKTSGSMILQRRVKDSLKKLGVKTALMRMKGAEGPTREVMGRQMEVAASGYAKIAEPIDWRRTLSYRSNVNGISVNLNGRESAGRVRQADYESVREKLLEELSELKDTRGQKIIGMAAKREDVFTGPQTDVAPDVVFTFKEDCVYGAYFDKVQKGSAFARSWKQGDHKLEGIVVGSGPAFRSGTVLKEAWIGDICPTVLYLLDCPIPNHIDGKVLSEAIRPEMLEMRSPTYSDSYADDAGKSPDAGDPGSGDRVRKHLRGLGYVD
jgi:predicted AlkP superfamily phosphohydrolase/phosphomutase